MTRFLLPFVLVLGLLLRILWLDKYPVGFTPDEVSFGYDAYSILKTGKDQWGESLPLVLESFGDFKAPLYSYLTIPTVSLFGLNKFAVRLPNAILGSFAILVVYFLTKELFKDKQSLAGTAGKKAAIISALLLAISPWHIQLSRGAFEANLTTFFLPLGILLFLKKKYSLSGIVFGLNLFSYHSARFITPLVVLSLAFFFRDQLKEKTKGFWIGVFVFTFLLGVAGFTFFQGAGGRAVERSITQGALEEAFSERSRSISLFHNKYTVIVERFFKNYVTYFSPQFLFTEGPREGTYGMVPGVGVFYLFVIPFILGVRKLLFEGKYKKIILFLSLWVLVSPIPASLATGVGYHANRVAVVIPAFEILMGIGAVEFISWIKNKKLSLYSFYLLVFVSFTFFLEEYFIQSPYKIGSSMLSGNLEVAEWVRDNIGSERKIIVDKSLSEPQIYFAFAEKIDPAIYQEATKAWNYETWVDQMPEYSLTRYTFRDIGVKDLSGDTLLIGRFDDFQGEFTPTKVFYYSDGGSSIYVFDPSLKYAKSN